VPPGAVATDATATRRGWEQLDAGGVHLAADPER